MRRLYHVLRRWLPALAVACALVLSLVAAPRAFAWTGPAGAASASPSASSSATRAASAPGEIRVRDKVIFVLRAARGDRSAQERARSANAALEAILAHPDDIGETRFEETQGTAVLYVGKTPVVTLGPEDVEASGEASISVLAAQVTARLSNAVAGERKRSAIATTVFSFSLLVFSALVAFLLLGRASDVASRVRTRLLDDPERIGAVKLGNVEFVSAGAARGTLTIAVTIGHRLVQVAIGYGWLIFALSLFESTRGYTERLTGMVLKPLYGLAERVGGALPLVVVAAIALFAVSVLVRFVGLFFESVERGATHIAWVPRELARPTSALVRFGIVITSLVLATPMLTGESDGALTRAGLVALVAVALAATPLLASAAVGVVVVFGRRFKKGDQIEIGGRAGRVLDVTLFDVRLEDPVLAEISVPHLLGLVHATRIHRHAQLTTLDVVVDASAPQDVVEKALFEAARAQSARGSVDLVYIDEDGAHWRVTSASMRHEVSLAKAVRDALDRIGVKLGRGRGARPGEARGGA
jgi:small-conductance mechanosensitive channel